MDAALANLPEWRVGVHDGRARACCVVAVEAGTSYGQGLFVLFFLWTGSDSLMNLVIWHDLID